jgi:hypothetical protein
MYEDQDVEISFTDVVQALAELADKNQMLTEQVAELQAAAQQPAGSMQLTGGSDGSDVALTAEADREIKRLHREQRRVCA